VQAERSSADPLFALNAKLAFEAKSMVPRASAVILTKRFIDSLVLWSDVFSLLQPRAQA